MRGFGQPGQLLVRDYVQPELELEVGDNAENVGVAAHIAVAVRGALDVRGARLDARNAIRDRHLGAVVRVYPDVALHLLKGAAGDLGEAGGDRATVRVA